MGEEALCDSGRMVSPTQDHAKERDKLSEDLLASPQSGPAYIIAECYQNNEWCAEQYDPDGLIAPQQPVAQLIGARKAAGTSNGSHVVRESVGCGDQRRRRQYCSFQRVPGSGPPYDPNDYGARERRYP